MAYLVTASGREERFAKRQDAITRAVECAKARAQEQAIDDPFRSVGVEIWSKPFWAVAIVRHYPSSGNTILCGYDRYGRERDRCESLAA